MTIMTRSGAMTRSSVLTVFLATAVWISASSTTTAFSTTRSTARTTTSKRTTSLVSYRPNICHTPSFLTLNIGFITRNFVNYEVQDGYNHKNIIDSSERIMARAQQCADSSSSCECSLEDAQHCLDDVLRVQMECVGGGVLTAKSSSTCCDNVDVVIDIVAKLRHKIVYERQRMLRIQGAMHMVNLGLGTLIVSMILHGLVSDLHVPVDAFLLSPATSSTSFSNVAVVVPFLPQEWIWAIRDGYLPLMISQWFQHGGLVVVADATSSYSDVTGVPIAPQEWVWALQTGSLGYLWQEYVFFGSLKVDASYLSTETVVLPLQLKEWWWALQGGYIDDAWKHFYRNGGL